MTGDLEGSVKRCGYCDKLVRWITIEGKSTAFNKDDSHHHCLADGTAKRRDKPIKHPRPTAAEVTEFLRPSSSTTTAATATAQAATPVQAASPQQQQKETVSPPQKQSAKDDKQQATDSPSTKVNQFGQDLELFLVASNKELAESNRQLAAVMLKVAESNNAIAESNKHLAESYAKFAAAITGTSQR